MKRLLLSITFLAVLAISLAVACYDGGPSVSPEGKGWNWSTTKSPITGRCYEIVTRSQGAKGYMGMSEIPCDEYK